MKPLDDEILPARIGVGYTSDRHYGKEKSGPFRLVVKRIAPRLSSGEIYDIRVSAAFEYDEATGAGQKRGYFSITPKVARWLAVALQQCANAEKETKKHKHFGPRKRKKATAD